MLSMNTLQKSISLANTQKKKKKMVTLRIVNFFEEIRHRKNKKSISSKLFLGGVMSWDRIIAGISRQANFYCVRQPRYRLQIVVPGNQVAAKHDSRDIKLFKMTNLAFLDRCRLIPGYKKRWKMPLVAAKHDSSDPKMLNLFFN